MFGFTHEHFISALSLYSKDPNAPEIEDVEKAKTALAWCGENNVEVLHPGHPDFPFDVSLTERVPSFFSYRGSAAWKKDRAISIVGSREPTRTALEWMDTHLAEFIRRNRVVIVSGGARGIDQKAHHLALRSGKPTLVFLQSGMAAPYPKEWSAWFEEVIATGGAVISTYSPWQEVRRTHFEERNQWIAAMGAMLFVVEARRKSGSSMTARLARDLGKTICVLPSSPGNPRSAGTLDLLFEGALPIRDASDLEILFNLHNLSAMPGAK